MATFTVTSNIDTAATDTSTGGAVTVGGTNYANAGNLRQAINFANANPGTTITFAGAGIGITFLQADLPLVAQNTTITGQTGVVIDGRPTDASAATYRGFLISGVATSADGVPPAITVNVSNLAIQNVLAKGGAGADGGGGGLGAGGAVFVGENADVTLTSVAVTNATAQGGAGAAKTYADAGGGGGLSGNGGTTVATNGVAVGGGGGGILFNGGDATNTEGGSSGGGGGGGGITGTGTSGVRSNGAGNGGNGGAGQGGIGGGGGGGSFQDPNPNGNGQPGPAGTPGQGGGTGAAAGSNAMGGTGGFGGGGGGSAGSGGGGGFGGGGGGSNGNPSGNGGFGGGGGGSLDTGGTGGFGGGGGGAQGETIDSPGTGGAGGIGAGGGNGSTGGGGLSAGGALFVVGGRTNASGTAIPGGRLTVVGGSFASDGVMASTGANAGAAVGQDLFLMTGSTNTLAAAQGAGLTVSKTIADDSAASLPTGSTFTAGNGAGGAVTIGNAADTGTVVLSAANTYSGTTSVAFGTLLVNGSILNSTTTVQSGGTLGGSGTTGAVAVQSGGTLSPGNSPGILNTGNLSLASGSTYVEQIGGTTAGNGSGNYDQTNVTGTVNLNSGNIAGGGATLSVSFYNGFTPTAGQTYTIINNDQQDAVQGTFAGLAEGSTVTVNGVALVISYKGGDGNDVTLTDPVPPPSGGNPTPAADPTITGTHATADAGEATVTPFGTSAAGGPVTIADTNANPMDSLTITLSGGGGTLTGQNGDLVQTGATSYALAATDPGTLTSELDALTFTPAAGAPGVANPTTFTLAVASNAGTSATDSNTVVTDTTAATTPTPVTPVTPTPVPVAPGSGGAVGVTPADTASLSNQVTYADGVFNLIGTASSASGVKGVEITAQVDGVVTDLGAATVDSNGNFSFKDVIGAHTQGFITATETDGANGTASAQVNYSLTGGLGRDGAAGRQTRYTADGSAETAVTRFRPDGSKSVNVLQPDQTFTSAFFDTFNNGGVPDTTFVFNPGYGRDVVDLFRVDGVDHDTLDLKGSDYGNSIATVLNASRDTGAGLLITDPVPSSPGTGSGHNDTLLLKGITKQQLAVNQGDIAFHA